MKHLVVFTEEKSAQVMLDSLLPRLMSKNKHCFRCVPFEGKQDLKKQLPIKLRGWRTPNTQFIVLCDQDNNDCKILKEELQDICKKASRPEVLIRIACRELESWYFGDLQSVGTALNIGDLSGYQKNAKYRKPDNIVNPANELKRITKNQYQKIGGSRVIGKHLSLSDSSSISFRHFIKGVYRIMGADE